MKISLVLTALVATMGTAPSSVAAEPIPNALRQSVRAAEGTILGAVDAAAALVKRVLPMEKTDLFPKGGHGQRYWAWSKLAYDDQWNTPAGATDKTLPQVSEKDWKLLASEDIAVWGFEGKPISTKIPGIGEVTVMNAVVGFDRQKNVIVLAFKGTKSLIQAARDLDFLPEDGPMGGQVHGGFKDCYESMPPEMMQTVETLNREHPTADIVYTGHSLGGGVAHIAASHTLRSGGDADLANKLHVFTYGAPRAGDLEFQKLLGSAIGTRMANFQHANDGFTKTGPISFGFANPAKRWIVLVTDHEDKWFDIDGWTHVQDADMEKSPGERRVVIATKFLLSGAKQHTMYFMGAIGQIAKRLLSFPSAITKRDGKSMTEGQLRAALNRAASLVTRDPRNSLQLKEFLTDDLGIDDLDEAMELLETPPEGYDQEEVLKTLAVFASEMGASGEGA